MKTHAMAVAHCPGCGHHLDAATGFGRVVSAGDFSLCFYCGAVGRFDAASAIRPVSDAELFALALDEPEFIEGLLRFKAAIRRRLRVGTPGA